MIKILTNLDFVSLPLGKQIEIQQAIKTKQRLEDWLLALNNKKIPEDRGSWIVCPHCVPGQPGKCRHCAPHNPGRCSYCLMYEGWFWKRDRDDRDIHPSQINKCAKALFYACHKEFNNSREEFVDPKLRMIFDLGHAWHDTVQGYGKKGAWGDPKDYYPEVQIDPDNKDSEGRPYLPVAAAYRIRGACDAVLDTVLKVPSMGDVAVRIVHEYKTINSGQYSKLTQPKPTHKWQANIYSAVFDVPIVVYLYVNKDNCQLADFTIPFDDKLWKEIKDKIDVVKYYIEVDRMPEWEHTSAVRNPRECSECAYRKVCKPPV